MIHKRLFAMIFAGNPQPINTQQQTALKVPTLLFNFMPNNIHVALSDTATGKLLFKLNSGSVGMKGTAKCSPKASLAIVDAVYAKLKSFSQGIHGGQASQGHIKAKKTESTLEQSFPIRVNFRGINPARPLIIHQLKKVGMDIQEVIDTTRIPFNGCRPKKSRRL